MVELLFPEERPDQPPTPCEQKTDTRKPEARTAGDARGQPLMAPPDAQQPLWSRVPKPLAALPGRPGQPGELPALKRNEFPLQVALENPLRFAGARPGGEAGAAAAGFARERATGSPPLVARRVPGVAAMPYERFGYALLPGWNGADEPDMAARQRPPPRGRHALGAGDGVGRPAGSRAGGARPAEAGPGGQPAPSGSGSPSPPFVGAQRDNPQAGLFQP